MTDGASHGKPLESLAHALADAKINGVDLWIGAGGQPLAAAAVPVVKPKTYMPNALGDDFAPFAQGNSTLPG